MIFSILHCLQFSRCNVFIRFIYSGYTIQQLSINDKDGDDITIQIISGDDSPEAKFQIIGNEIRTTNSPIDYESLGGQDFSYSLIVTGTDVDHTATTTVVVTVSTCTTKSSKYTL